MKLNLLFKEAPDIEIEQLSTDSRLPMRNAIFFCLDGIKYDGHKFINDAIKNGAKVIVYSKEITNKEKAIYIKVKNVNDTLCKIADIFYNNPGKNINKYVISGCYGRSSVNVLMKHYLDKVSSCGSVGVFGINYADKHLSIAFPALTPLENVKVLDNLRNNNIKNAIFETSAISIFYKKMDIIKPNVFVYTCTSKYSSDYRVCNNMYYENIRRYLYGLEDNTCVLFNIDDESFEELNHCVNNFKTYGVNNNADYRIKDVNLKNTGTSFTINYLNKDYYVKTKLLGITSVYNITAAICALNIMNYDLSDIISNLSDVSYIDGVMERIDDDYNIIVDCGYEIDGIKNTLEFAKQAKTGKLIGIIGINYSDSDEKIKKIVEIAEKNLDIIIFTEYESQDGEVSKILDRTNQFIKTNKAINISYRSIAIENAINIMNKNDTLLILGKGNENYMNMGLGKERYLGDKHYACKYINKRKKEENEII